MQKKACDVDQLMNSFGTDIHLNQKKEGQKYYEIASGLGSVAGKWWNGYCLYNGHCSQKNTQEGAKLMLMAALSGDRFWTLSHAKILENGHYGFTKNKDQAQVF
jgi:hypothetical protein